MKKGNHNKITMGNKTQVNPKGGTGTVWSWTGYQYVNSNTTNKPRFNSNITKLKDAVFAQGRPFDAEKYEDSIKTLIRYDQLEYSVGVYLVQAIQEVKVPDFALPAIPKKDNNQSDA